MIEVLDQGCDRIHYNKIAKKNLYSDHVWKVLIDLSPVVFNCDVFVIEAPRYPDQRRGDLRIKRTIVIREGYWEQVGAKSCITNELGVVVGWKTVFTYVIGRSILEEAEAIQPIGE